MRNDDLHWRLRFSPTLRWLQPQTGKPIDIPQIRDAPSRILCRFSEFRKTGPLLQGLGLGAPIRAVTISMMRICLFAAACLFFSSAAVLADSIWERFEDPSDGKFDLSGWSKDKRASVGGLVPVPKIISEPAIGGFGLALGLAYLREKNPPSAAEKAGTEADEAKRRPPRITGIGGFYSLNNSWFVGGGHYDNWLEDTFRYQGGVGYGSLNLDFYGTGLNGKPRETPIPIVINGFVFLQDLRYRLLKSDFFVGGRYTFFRPETTIDISGRFPRIPPVELDLNDGGLGPTLLYDTRDNISTPTRGGMVNVSAMFHDPNVGGDFTYQIYKAGGFLWVPIHSAVILALRLEGSLASGSPPFYARPYISLRGIPALRYQDNAAIMAEIEARWQFLPRWSILGFAGSGRVAGTVDDLGDADRQNTVGTGFRYFIARKFGLHAGVDIAWGPEQAYYYITIGSAW